MFCIAGVIIELIVPGFGVPGILGVTAFVLYFFGNQVAGFAGWETWLLFVIGIVMLVYGSGRGKKGFGKVTGFVAAVYNGVTGFFSHIMSYIRLMALMLSGAVLAQVFNKLGATTGSIVFFIVISLVGNTLNLALNLLGCYVHDMRLQFLEFFGRFYKEGGKAYRPLCVQSKYVEIMKEDTEK